MSPPAVRPRGTRPELDRHGHSGRRVGHPVESFRRPGPGPEGRPLLERDAEIDAVRAAITAVRAGPGTAVVVTGGAGMGKSSVVRAALAGRSDDLRVLTGACDDLPIPWHLGALREAAAGTGGALERAMTGDATGDALFAAAGAEFTGPRPSVLVVEDVQWADAATLRVLGWLARRLDRLRLVLLLTVRDDRSGIGSSALGSLDGALTGVPLRRVTLGPLSVAAVAALAAGSGRDPAEVHAVTGGNPFLATEVLAAPQDELPAAVVTMAAARLHRLDAEARLACEQLSVLPARVGYDLARAVLGDTLDALATVEDRGLVDVAADGLLVRPELVRRAIEQTVPTIRRRRLHAAVVAALQATGATDPGRLAYHAQRAGDVAVLVRHAPVAARQAARDGFRGLALAGFEAAVPHADRLPLADRAALVDDYAWELLVAHRFTEALPTARAAVRLRERAGDSEALGDALLRLARHLAHTGHVDEVEATIERASRVLCGTGSTSAHAGVQACRGALRAITGRSAEAVALLGRAHRQAAALGRADLVALTGHYLGVARTELGDPAGTTRMRHGLAAALVRGDHEATARGYAALAEMLYREGRWDELAAVLDSGVEFTRARGYRMHLCSLTAHHALLAMRRGRWDLAEERLRTPPDGVDAHTAPCRHHAPVCGRLLARRGDPDAGPVLAAAWAAALAWRSLDALGPTGIAYAEWAWLAGHAGVASAVAEELLGRTELPGTAPIRGELLRYLARAGAPAPPFDGGGDGPAAAYAAGLRGDWRDAASRWERLGDRYEQALELAESGKAEPTLTALQILLDLGADPAADLVRRRLHEIGVRRIPRRPAVATRAHPAGLTRRQVDVLDLLSTGMTNREIAGRLVISVRTVDHHVAAILTKLGVRTRRQAAAATRAL